MSRVRGSKAGPVDPDTTLHPKIPCREIGSKAPVTAELLILETISAKRYRYTRRSRQSCPSSLDARRWPGVVRKSVKSVKTLYQKRLSRPILLPLCDILCALYHLLPAPTVAERLNAAVA